VNMKRTLKRYGGALFIFYLVKGLAWLIVPAIIAYTATNGDTP